VSHRNISIYGVIVSHINISIYDTWWAKVILNANFIYLRVSFSLNDMPLGKKRWHDTNLWGERRVDFHGEEHMAYTIN
jgi:hypothetical protein